jgi:hypothetical protein
MCLFRAFFGCIDIDLLLTNKCFGIVRILFIKINNNAQGKSCAPEFDGLI